MTNATAPQSAAPHGVEWRPGEGTLFRLWAPKHDSIDLVIEGAGASRHPMSVKAEGWKEVLVPEAGPGTRYRFGLPDGLLVPDPASRFQPDDVHGASEVVDPAAFVWSDRDWAGRDWHEVVLYELHIGTFTPEGTFQAAIGKLDHLAALGVTAVEVMPVSDFPGLRNWGYDGVLPYAPDATYGRPEDFKAFVSAAHGRGIAVILDVVYNHFGPDGNYLGAYAPGFFTERHHTPWGAAVNVDGDHSGPVRDYFIGNALYWLTEFHLDGLRFDAVHAILDDSDLHLLRELVETVRNSVTERPIHLLLENEDNVASRLKRDHDGSLGRYTAQWNDDVHHVLHVAATGEDRGYYEAYANKTELLGRALAEGFAYQGEFMPYRDSERGEPSAGLPPGAFVAFLQNHDQIGNRAFGERIGAVAKPGALRAVSAVAFLLPQIPMLFMGEEWGASTPFLFFCDFEGELAEAVRTGRREEFKRFPEFQDPAMRERIPDPEAAETFVASKLKWDEIDQAPHHDQLAWTRRILAVRRTSMVPLTRSMDGHAATFRTLGPGAVAVTWTTRDGTRLHLDANLKADPQDGFEAPSGTELWLEGQAEARRLGPWSVRWTVQQPTR
ncbi:malto-oligosyltrehalose trehalohydrolase [Lichenihabitans sp. Uapishka_5]|uniref:malto-oligosyltrehalose trehalohydrolase n=1 Tax=Lichenihabitans sp. Uapishka_5 TaxID=3037302 RepID=UPI0029E7FBD1|nr:malto-oligosyltrehalose trehalohydrolase [Lichenihabitans sp. Uapishka_5]MDX7950698.1 malto-oligosyltrehalose trehalohydrolase [Lichenihabitans sp. Uapishka_5]